MLADGKTWKVTRLYQERCDIEEVKLNGLDILDQKKQKSAMEQNISSCINKRKEDFVAEGRMLCGNEPSRVFYCQMDNPSKPSNSITCFIECKL